MEFRGVSSIVLRKSMACELSRTEKDWWEKDKKSVLRRAEAGEEQRVRGARVGSSEMAEARWGPRRCAIIGHMLLRSSGVCQGPGRAVILLAYRLVGKTDRPAAGGVRRGRAQGQAGLGKKLPTQVQELRKNFSKEA